MKKTLIFSMILLLASGITLKAQTEKGRFFIAGSNSLELNLGVEKHTADGTKFSYYDFDLLPRVGYTFINNLAAGLFMDIDFYGNKSKETDGYSDNGVTFIIGPFVRYYIHVCDKFIPYAEAQVGFGIDNYKYRYSSTADFSKTDESVFSYRLGGGATYFFNKNVGLDLFLGYAHDSYKLKDTGSPARSSDSKYVYGEFLMQLGVVVMLDK
jgi:opacity protein-like surface antigen